MVEWYTDGETLTVLPQWPYSSKALNLWPSPVTKPCSRGLHPHGRAQYLRVFESLELNAPIPLGDFPFASWFDTGLGLVFSFMKAYTPGPSSTVDR